MKKGLGWNRVTSGLAALGFAVAITVAGGFWFALAIAAIIFFGEREFFQLASSRGSLPAVRWTLVLSLLLVGVQFWRPEWTTAAFITLGSLVCFQGLLKAEAATITDMATGLLGLFYCGYLPSFWIAVRARPDGLGVTLLAYGCIIAGDVGAYVMGKAVGKTPLSALSPHKTLEGTLFGILASAGVSLAGTYLFAWDWPWAVGLGILIGVVGCLGDLTESLMKRDAGVKDAGSLLPGHGGILDRGDSYVFTAPLVYFYLQTWS
ncbi:MAG: phosphatidate cytidylyltransferase [Thermostichales cyanobacterium SZTDM-1c_bins_54]